MYFSRLALLGLFGCVDAGNAEGPKDLVPSVAEHRSSDMVKNTAQM